MLDLEQHAQVIRQVWRLAWLGKSDSVRLDAALRVNAMMQTLREHDDAAWETLIYELIDMVEDLEAEAVKTRG